MVFVEAEADISYPVAMLDDLTIHFVHYASNEGARDAWIRRLKRLNMDNLFVILVERVGWSYEELLQFDAVRFENKVVFTHKPYADIKSAYYIRT